MARNQNASGSEILGVQGDVLAWNFNRACNFRLLVFDKEVMEAQAKRIADEVRKILVGDSES